MLWDSPRDFGRRTCEHCNGTGRCRHCRGSGLKNYPGYGRPPFNEPCPWCYGTGVCRHCRGTGER
ncbi:MAG: hypothetical protein HPY68_08795 [Candidatus Atribacteria bacterium]|nr:hypothetical protein [Candidatus Atribacteria bacterium]